jgi:peptide/nickel transport system substrate-binding protein
MRTRSLGRARGRGATHGWLLVALLSIIIAAVAACGGTSSSTTSSTSANTDVLRIASRQKIATWDPRASAADEVTYFANCYEPLLWSNPPGSAQPFRPALATSWEVSQDGFTWTFHLRQGVKFHDGTPFNAAAVKYSIEATKKLGIGASYIWYPLKKVKIVDDYTVKLITSYPAPMDRVASSMYGAWMFSPKTEGKSQAWWDQAHEAGTGPYTLESYKPGEEIVFQQNPDYWGGWKPNQFKKVVTKIVVDSTTMRQSFEAGEVDWADSLPRDAIPALEKNPNLKIIKKPSVQSEIMQINTRVKPLDNVKVRQALSYATPYQDIIEVGVNGFAKQSRGPIPSGLYPHDPDLLQYTYDIEKAKQLMAEAGYGSGSTKLLMTYTSDEPYAPKFVSLIKEAYAKIGIDLQLQPMLYEQQWERAKGPANDRQAIFVQTWWPGWPDGYDSLYSLLHSESPVLYNLSYWYNKSFDNLIDSAFSYESTNPTKAQDLYNQAQQMAVDQAPIIYLFDLEMVYGSSPLLKLAPEALNENYSFVLFWYYVTK